ncbi:hypothetical protein EMPS_00076 [Entomortierella parvispora]|uniref:Uncharacterized protein n=1 Tax=Entomortierella parvispora TaxID=205924 RepID=A0A9P3GZ64_9FUNG|nr:hypothetical protein EMPS_00076 [Entomortierella parvispora]
MMLRKHTKKRDWRDSVNSARSGAGYFLGLRGDLNFSPNGYIEFRDLRREECEKLLQEWDGWMRTLRNSPYAHVKIAANIAPSMSRKDLYAYYRERILLESETTSLENSSKKIADAEQELILLAQKRRASRYAQENCEELHVATPAHVEDKLVGVKECGDGVVSQQKDDLSIKKRKRKNLNEDPESHPKSRPKPYPKSHPKPYPKSHLKPSVEFNTTIVAAHPEIGTVDSSAMNHTSLLQLSTPIRPKQKLMPNVKPSKCPRISKTKIREPWHSLIEAALTLYDGWEVDLPQVETEHTQESGKRSKLYQLALLHLRNAQSLQNQAKFDKSHCLDYKDAFVALSGVWNTYSSTANSVFGQNSTEEVKAMCHIQSLDEKNTVLGEITDSMLDKTSSLEEMLDETYHLQIAYPTYRRVIDVIQILIRNIVKPLHGSKAPSEADCLAVWSSIFQEGLPLSSHLSLNLGEQGCSASALSKSKLADVFEMGTMPRKCDGLLSVDSFEIGNFEFKRASAPKLEAACQLRKTIKINKSILLELDKHGLECPPLLSVHGMTAIVFTIKKWDDIWVAGKASSTIVLPSTLDEFRYFLRNPVHQLLNLLDHYHEYAEHVHQLYQIHQYQRKGDDEEDAVSLSPKGIIETLEWEQVVLHTPTKVAKRPSVQERLQRAKEEADEEDMSADWDCTFH